MMRRILTILTVLMAFLPAILGAEALPTGYWEGELAVQPGVSLTLGFTITDEGGRSKASLAIPQQGVKGLPVDEVVFEAGSATVTFQMRSIGAEYSGTITVGDTIQISGVFKQMGATFPLVITLQQSKAPQPVRKSQEPVPPFPYLSEEVRFLQSPQGFWLAGTITRPADNRKHAAVVLVTGSGSQDRDESIMGHKPFLVLADTLTRAGIVVLRFDDRGFAASQGDASQATTFDFADDAESALTFLASQPYVDTDRIGILGHSEGGIIAPIIAARNQEVDFLILMAGSGVDGIRVLEDQTGALLRAQGAPQAVIDQIVALNLHIYRTIIDEQIPLSDRHAAVTRLLASAGLDQRSIQAQLSTLFSPWYMTFLTLDPADYLKSVHVPVLILNGTKDTQVTSSLNVPAIERALHEAGNKSYRTYVYEGLNHLFQPATTGSVEEYATIETTISPAVLRDLLFWMLDR